MVTKTTLKDLPRTFAAQNLVSEIVKVVCKHINNDTQNLITLSIATAVEEGEDNMDIINYLKSISKDNKEMVERTLGKEITQSIINF